MPERGNKEILSENLKRLMIKNGVTRKDVCRDLGIKYTTLTDWINAKTYPRIDKIESLAGYFGVSKADLIEPPKPHGEGFTISELLDMRSRKLQGESVEKIEKEYREKHEKERQKNRTEYLKIDRKIARQDATANQWKARLKTEKDILSNEEQEENQSADTESLFEDIARLQKNFIDLLLVELNFALRCGVIVPHDVKNMDILSIHQTVIMRLAKSSEIIQKAFNAMYSEYMPALLYGVQNMYCDILDEIPYKERQKMGEYGRTIFQFD